MKLLAFEQPKMLVHKRMCIFASYSADNKITNEVIYYLNELKKVVDGIIFIADNEYPASELEKISDLVIHTDCQHHGKYDFGSYAKGFEWFKKSDLFENTEELLICNDSVLGPYRSLNFFFDGKEKKGNPPFFGCTINHLALNGLYPHVQSYFFTLHQSVFTQSFFAEFMSRIKEEKDKTDIVIKYEQGLTKLMEKHNIKFGALFSEKRYCDPCREFIELFDQMLFIKRNRLKSYHIFKLNMLLAKIKFPYFILNNKFSDKSLLNKILIGVFFVLEPARIIRETDFYKQRKYNKKVSKYKK